MRNSRTILIAAALMAATQFTTAVEAAYFVGSSANITDFANGSEVSTNGKLIDAVNLMNANIGGVGISTTINGVLFKGTQPGAYHEGAESFAEASFVYHGGDVYSDNSLWSSGGAYETLARSQIYGIDTGASVGDGFGVVNLTPGITYELQVFMLDDRDGVSKTFPMQVQQTTFTGFADQLVNSGADSQEIGYFSGISINGIDDQGEIATLRFRIDAGFNGVLVNTWDNGAFNGMQLRALPEPASLAMCGLACLVLTGSRRRVR